MVAAIGAGAILVVVHGQESEAPGAEVEWLRDCGDGVRVEVAVQQVHDRRREEEEVVVVAAGGEGGGELFKVEGDDASLMKPLPRRIARSERTGTSSPSLSTRSSTLPPAEPLEAPLFI